ncbi:MAG: DUF4962 domain-containing protein [Planctomycetes bacterium]|nr:DUF4962 domain-containing protein [Planctomycetota bacterium]
MNIRKVLLLVTALVVFGQAAWSQTEGKQGRSATMNIRKEHPRIWLDEDRIAFLKAKVKGKSLEDVRKLAGTSAQGRALAYVITGSRATGREAVEMAMKMTGGNHREYEARALVYDWCNDLLASDEKAALLKILADTVRNAIDSGRSWRSFHDMMYQWGWRAGAAALAIYGDDPAGEEGLRFIVEEWRDALKVFRHIYPDGAWGEGYCYNHHVLNNALKFFLALETATGVDMFAESPYMMYNGYYMIYGAKPDGLVYPGDDNDFPYLNERDHEGLLLMIAAYGNPHYQYFVNHCEVERFALWPGTNWAKLLWYDPSADEKPTSELPLSRIFRGEGLVIARSGWGWDKEAARSGDSWVSFRCGKYYGDHAHLDNNAFEIYYKGELAIDSGRYDDDWGMEGSLETVQKSQFFNYCKRAIAHNTILVYDPDEKMAMGVVNDGGQAEQIRIGPDRTVPEDYDQGTYPSATGPGKCDWVANPGRWDTGRILAYKATKDFTYVCGDATKSYSPHKMKRFVRQMLFIQPDTVVVFDDVVSTNAAFKKTWLLHSVEEPTLIDEGRRFSVEYGEGRLVCVPVLPKERDIVKIGGPGDEFLVGGIHYRCGPKATGVPSALHYGEIPGAWRVEESPAEPALEDYFLNVMLVTDAGSTHAPKVTVLGNGDDAIKIKVETPAGKSAVVTFAKGEKHSAALAIESGGQTLFTSEMPQEVVLEEGRP